MPACGAAAVCKWTLSVFVVLTGRKERSQCLSVVSFVQLLRRAELGVLLIVQFGPPGIKMVSITGESDFMCPYGLYCLLQQQRQINIGMITSCIFSLFKKHMHTFTI